MFHVRLHHERGTLCHRLEACKRDDALTALQLLAAGADPKWAGPLDVALTDVAADLAGEDAEGNLVSCSRPAESTASLSLLERARACGSSRCVELLTQFGAAQRAEESIRSAVAETSAIPDTQTLRIDGLSQGAVAKLYGCPSQMLRWAHLPKSLKPRAHANCALARAGEGTTSLIGTHTIGRVSLVDVSATDVSKAFSRNAEAAAAVASSAAASASAAFAKLTGGAISSQVFAIAFVPSTAPKLRSAYFQDYKH